MTIKNSEICCPQFEPSIWDKKLFSWENKQFIKDNICTFMYMPLNFGKVMKRLDTKVRTANAEVPEWLCLSEHTSPWNMNIYLAVNKKIDDAENVTKTGNFYSQVYEGSFNKIGVWTKDYLAVAKQNGYTTGKLYMWYTTCPKCAKKYGKNYIVIIAEILNKA